MQKALQSKYKYTINTYSVLRLPAVLRTHLFTAAATVVSSVYITYRQVEHGWLEVKLELKGRGERGRVVCGTDVQM